MFSVNRYFPLLAIAVSVLAWYEPQPLLGLKDAIVPLLTIVMFCMGLTLRWADFRRVWNKPQPIALGVLLQFTLMPLIAWLLVHLLQLPSELAIGLIIVGACAGGTASNVMTYLAGGDVALSVSMTLVSTLWGVVLTPWLVAFYSSADIAVDTLAMIISIAQLVLLPIAGGLLCNHFLPQVGRSLNSHLPDIASAFILAIIAIIVALNADEIATMGSLAVIAVMLHNLIGLAAAYGIARWNGHTEVEARTIALEVGMQNSGLGVALALKFYGPVAALPGALFSVWHNISGSLLAAFWKWQTNQKIRTMRQKNAVKEHP
ncbi:MAG: bile acid:sodium symporter family protein [Saccharospirillaceae bacterium]|nr:bile acid:sodium symporter family protein [Saccharospirillaceae bacterium]MCD8531069.1 bile acid:sodium symporter family protein [Saccharospirillaceae bacterium]